MDPHVRDTIVEVIREVVNCQGHIIYVMVMVVVAHLEWPLQGCQLQQGRCSQGCALCSTGGGWEQVMPTGALHPTKLVGWEPVLPGADAAVQPPSYSSRPRHPFTLRIPGSPLPLQAWKCLFRFPDLVLLLSPLQCRAKL